MPLPKNVLLQIVVQAFALAINKIKQQQAWSNVVRNLHASVFFAGFLITYSWTTYRGKFGQVQI